MPEGRQNEAGHHLLRRMLCSGFLSRLEAGRPPDALAGRLTMGKLRIWLGEATNTKDFVEGCCAIFCMAFIFGVWFLVQWLLWF